MGDPACIRAEPKEALQGTSLCEPPSSNWKWEGSEQEAGAERKEGRLAREERQPGPGPGPGKKQDPRRRRGGRGRSKGGHSAAVRATVGRRGLARRGFLILEWLGSSATLG